MRSSVSIFGLALSALLLCGFAAIAEDAAKDEPVVLKVGDTAPDFVIKKAEGDEKEVKLSDYKGEKNVVLAFYPKAFTSGCTKQLCGYRDNFGRFQNGATEIIAISGDEQADSDKFKKEYEMPFTVLGDPDHVVIDKYGVPMKDFGGNLYAQRSIFVVDKEGVIQLVDMEYDIMNDEKPLMSKIEELSGGSDAEADKSAADRREERG